METVIDWSKALLTACVLLGISGCDATSHPGTEISGSGVTGSGVHVVRDGNVSCYTFWRSISCAVQP